MDEILEPGGSGGGGGLQDDQDKVKTLATFIPTDYTTLELKEGCTEDTGLKVLCAAGGTCIFLQSAAAIGGLTLALQGGSFLSCITFGGQCGAASVMLPTALYSTVVDEESLKQWFNKAKNTKSMMCFFGTSTAVGLLTSTFTGGVGVLFMKLGVRWFLGSCAGLFSLGYAIDAFERSNTNNDQEIADDWLSIDAETLDVQPSS